MDPYLPKRCLNMTESKTTTIRSHLLGAQKQIFNALESPMAGAIYVMMLLTGLMLLTVNYFKQ
jgi:hypothetical protein